MRFSVRTRSTSERGAVRPTVMMRFSITLRAVRAVFVERCFLVAVVMDRLLLVSYITTH
jgi:hypothetical protein